MKWTSDSTSSSRNDDCKYIEAACSFANSSSRSVLLVRTGQVIRLRSVGGKLEAVQDLQQPPRSTDAFSANALELVVLS